MEVPWALHSHWKRCKWIYIWLTIKREVKNDDKTFLHEQNIYIFTDDTVMKCLHGVLFKSNRMQVRWSGNSKSALGDNVCVSQCSSISPVMNSQLVQGLTCDNRDRHDPPCEPDCKISADQTWLWGIMCGRINKYWPSIFACAEQLEDGFTSGALKRLHKRSLRWQQLWT